jgi:hypothetical protein
MRRPSHLLFAVLALVGSPLAATTPLGIHIHSDKAMFQVLISPGTVGADNFVLQLMSGSARREGSNAGVEPARAGHGATGAEGELWGGRLLACR